MAKIGDIWSPIATFRYDGKKWDIDSMMVMKN
jgi:hypothetical protein